MKKVSTTLLREGDLIDGSPCLEGALECEILGIIVKVEDLVGIVEGDEDGACESEMLGSVEGYDVGVNVGDDEGDNVGNIVGNDVGGSVIKFVSTKPTPKHVPKSIQWKLS